MDRMEQWHHDQQIQAIDHETRAKVLKKVIDIDTPGIAYHTIQAVGRDRASPTLKHVTDVLQYGILPTDLAAVVLSEKPITHIESYRRAIAAAKKRRDRIRAGSTYYSTVRADHYRFPTDDTQISYDRFTTISPAEPYKIGILFKPQKHKTEYTDFFEEDIPSIRAILDFGRVTNQRITPREFVGLFVRAGKDVKGEYVEDDQATHEMAKELAQLMLQINANRLDRLVPIYDVHGNLLWPERRGYEQLKRTENES